MFDLITQTLKCNGICYYSIQMKFSTKRKSHDSRTVQQLLRRPKRYRTYTKQSLANLKNCKDGHMYAQPVVCDILYQIVDAAYDEIWKKNRKQALQNVAVDCIVLGNNVLSVSLITSSNSKCCMKDDIEPNTIQCDNFCGVDQAGNNNSDKISKIDKRTIFHATSTSKKHYDSHKPRMRSTGNLFTMQDRRKQTSESHDVSFSSTVNLDKNTPVRNNLFHLKDRSKYSHKLIPLFKQRDEESSEVKIEQLFRDKLLKEISNKKMSIKLKQMNQISTLSMAAKTADQFNFDYNGDKINLHKGAGNKTFNNILKTTYKINKDKNQIKQHQIRASIKFRPSLANDGFSVPLKQKLISAIRTNNQTQDAFNVKSALETQFKKRKINYRLLNVE